jgi:hypothetical protein
MTLTATTLDLVIIGIGLVCAIELGVLLARSERLARVLKVQLNGLGATYLQGLEILTMDVDKLKAKVRELEDEVL